MRYGIALGVLAVAAAAAALVLLPAPSGAPGDAGDPAPRGLVASVTSQPHACSLCHYAWDDTFRFEGSVEETADGWLYRMQFAPVAAYHLRDVRVVPVAAGREALSAFRIPATGAVLRGTEAVVPIHVSNDASSLFVLLTSDRAGSRSDLRLALDAPGGRLDGFGAGSTRGLVWAPPEGVPAGTYDARIAYAGGPALEEPFRLLADFAPTRVAVVANGSGEAPAVFEFLLPARVRGFAVQLRPFNEHPTDRWQLPNTNDYGEVSAFVGEGAPAERRNWTDEEIDALWGGATEKRFHESSQDGVLVRTQDERGEWTRRGQWVEPPGPEEPFSPLLPGTREVVAEIHWAPRTPVSPAATPYFSYASGTSPVFYYPEPEVDEPGRRVYRVPVPETWWQDPSEIGGFQGFALLPLDDNRMTVFDGRYGVTLTARR